MWDKDPAHGKWKQDRMDVVTGFLRNSIYFYLRQTLCFMSRNPAVLQEGTAVFSGCEAGNLGWRDTWESCHRFQPT